MTSHNPAVSGSGGGGVGGGGGGGGGGHPLDDIPTAHPAGTDGNSNNSLDDVWGGSDYDHQHYYHYDPAAHQQHPYPYQQHPLTPHQAALDLVVSDVPRLARAHQTAGYRDGIALAKARTAQQGFDEGYPLGAHLGARAGQLLGWRGVLYDEARRLEAVLGEARRELGVAGVFDGQYWGPDGTWRYQVTGDSGGGGGSGGGSGDYGMSRQEGEEEAVFPDVAEAHPLLRKWSRIVRAEAARYGVDWEVLKDDAGDARVRRVGGEDDDEEEYERGREGRMGRERAGQQQPQPAVRGREALAW
ncbi:hypothetical protein MYCTH_105869 [Thermothelomyces thermophilus ATCC 42464]|uniref:Protein YAE1 n=1 Tax=Thermothelomyces thermophilus (strain ATCC 42464 / BCRC 31852 / DSM 1799) TaxID=573729 RepID=G2Q4G4_THET4|nr:uncharacterized protein MYCTH_105869 [Thermothelomyces thermophilus ATCC 42464]AEO53657.1 hypothetical protein MYCTH_105869 [Thermothelomyces thermophilus ATCC 42464]